MKGIVFLVVLAAFLTAPILAQGSACEVVTDAAATAVIGAGFVSKSIPMGGEGKAVGTVCSRRKGKQLVQVTLLPGAIDKGMSLQDMLKKQAQEASQDSSDNVKITVIPQAGIGDEAFSTSFEAAQVKFTNVAVRKGKTVLLVQVFNSANHLTDALSLAKQGASRLP